MDFQTLLYVSTMTRQLSRPKNFVEDEEEGEFLDDGTILSGSDDDEQSLESESESESEVEETMIKDEIVPLTSEQLTQAKMVLLQTVCSSIVQEPQFHKKENEVRQTLISLINAIAINGGDPEFILKVALYCRYDLGIRSTTNFILAVASIVRPCAPFIMKYFHHCVVLPTDWMDVATYTAILKRENEVEIQQQAAKEQGFDETAIDGKNFRRKIPSCLRSAMREKFKFFDAYQLSKYNNERKIKRQIKKKEIL
eukprot:c17329_g1_i1.p1 GENE.c17329_g1_i1~~c17329_g1_i1.p1  ORF type:complete len:254 (+),score=95.46 c17329_g1_i1:71-832(+)